MAFGRVFPSARRAQLWLKWKSVYNTDTDKILILDVWIFQYFEVFKEFAKEEGCGCNEYFSSFKILRKASILLNSSFKPGAAKVWQRCYFDGY